MENYISLEERVNWTLSQKIAHSLMLIDEFYHHFNGQVYISFSGGKDSVLIKWLCDKFTDMAGYPRIRCVFSNTTNEHQQILDFVKSFGDQIEWLRPKITFAQSLEKYGFPLISKEQSRYIDDAKRTKSPNMLDLRLNGRKKFRSDGSVYYQGKISEKWKFLIDEDIKITNRCCDKLKKEPFKRFEKETGLKPIIGITHDESSLRKQSAKQNFCNMYGDRPQSKPINIYTEQDVWDVIILNKIPYCVIYDDQIIDGVEVKGEKRTGCAYCGFGVHLEDPKNTRFHKLYYREPKRYKSMMDKLGYRDALHKIGIVLPDDDPYNIGIFKK